MSGVVQQTEELPDFWFWAKHFRNATRENLCQGMLFWTSGLDDDHQFGGDDGDGDDDDDDEDDDAVFFAKKTTCICPHCFVRFYQTCKEFGFYQTCEVPSGNDHMYPPKVVGKLSFRLSIGGICYIPSLKLT